MSAAVQFLAGIRDTAWFQNFITIAILAAGVVVGFETYPSMVERHGGVLHFLNELILWIFVAEIVVKMGAEGKTFWRYFYDPWNVFDFIIVAVCFMPFNASFVAVLRLVRLLRVLKLVTAIPKLQVLVGALLKSIPSMFYVSILLFLMFYLYACAAVFLFSENDPVHFSNLQMSFLSLFRVVTLEDWTDVMYIQMYGCADYGYDGMMELCTASVSRPLLGALFFVSFVMLGTMVVLNLFIGVIMNSMDEAQAETAKANQKAAGDTVTVSTELAALTQQLAALQERLAKIQSMHKDSEAS